MDLLIHGALSVYFIFRFLHFGVEKILSRTFGLPFPMAEALTWAIVGTVGVFLYRKWRR